MPTLTVIAGCNGAGKSTFAHSFLPEGVVSFNFDRLFLETYNSLPDSELRDTMAINLTNRAFENAIEKSLATTTDFCYETNFDEHPTYWADMFKKKGYQTNLIFFCLESIEIAVHRVAVRQEFNGHYIDEETIKRKWKAGYKNVNLHYSEFDNVLIIDNSIQNEMYKNILNINSGTSTLMVRSFPEYLKHRLPDIYKTLG